MEDIQIIAFNSAKAKYFGHGGREVLNTYVSKLLYAKFMLPQFQTLDQLQDAKIDILAGKQYR